MNRDLPPTRRTRPTARSRPARSSRRPASPPRPAPALALALLALAVACGGGEPTTAPARSSGDPGPSAPGHTAEEQSAGEHPDDEHDGSGEPEAGIVHLDPEKLSRADLDTAEARLVRLDAQMQTTGEVDYERDRLAHVSPRIPGRVQRVPASLGDEVSAGRVLAVLDSVELGQARAEYLAALTRESVARENHERERALYRDRISSEKEMLEAEAELRQARARRQSAEETLRLYGLSSREIDSIERGSPGASLLSVRSPIAGRVVDKHVTVGELVTPEDNLFTVADLGRVWIWIDVFERDLARVHEDDRVEVQVEAFPERTFSGEVTYLAPEVAPETRTVRARIDVENPDRLLRPGMFATVRLTDPHSEGSRQSLVIPRAALVRDGDRAVVFQPLGEGRFRARHVETGRLEGDRAEVLTGLEPGDRVVTRGSFLLKSELARGEMGGGHSH